jgi:lipid II:glycine glycyltransferase (peptidoglycan interpeptide bridge formation enzyme)
MTSEIVEVRDKGLWEGLASSATPNSFLQSWSWGEVNEALGRKIWRLGALRDGQLVAIGLLVKLESLLADHLYCPRGPIGDWNEPAAVHDLLTRAADIAGAEGCAFVRVDPLLSHDRSNRTLLAARGFVSAAAAVQTDYVRLLALSPSEDELLAAMRKTTRYLVRREPRRGITVETSEDAEDARRFFDLLDATASRKGFVNHPREYYLKQFQILSRDGMEKIFIARRGETVLAMAMVVYYDGMAYYLYGASNPRRSESLAYLLQWEAIKDAKRRGCRYYNMLGALTDGDLDPRHPWYGFSRFKRGFGGFEQRYLRAQDLPLSPRYWLYRYVEKGRRWVRGARRWLR